MSLTELVVLYLRTFVIGLAVAMPVGAMGVLCMERTLQRGWSAGVQTGAGIATADGVYAAVAAFGITSISALLVSWLVPLRVAGGAALVFLGVRAVLIQPTASARAATPDRDEDASPLGLYASAVGLTLTNPMTIIAFAAVFAGAGLAGLTTTTAATVATVGVTTGSFVWWFALTTVVGLLRHAVSDTSARVLTRMSGAIIAGFGAVALLSALL